MTHRTMAAHKPPTRLSFDSIMQRLRSGVHLEKEMAVDLGKEGAPRHKSISHLQAVDAEGHVIDVHEVDAEGCGQPGLLGLVCFVGRLGNEGQIALNALQVQVFKVPSLPYSCCTSRRSDDCCVQHLLQRHAR